MPISAKDVKALRDRTGAGMMDCKKALTEADGDLERAIDILRARGAAKAAKRAKKSANEGTIGSYVHFDKRTAVIVEVNCETDFVANTDAFRQLAKDLALHTAAQAPPAVSPEDHPNDLVGPAGRGGAVEPAGRPGNRSAAAVDHHSEALHRRRVAVEDALAAHRTPATTDADRRRAAARVPAHDAVEAPRVAIAEHLAAIDERADRSPVGKEHAGVDATREAVLADPAIEGARRSVADRA